MVDLITLALSVGLQGEMKAVRKDAVDSAPVAQQTGLFLPHEEEASCGADGAAPLSETEALAAAVEDMTQSVDAAVVSAWNSLPSAEQVSAMLVVPTVDLTLPQHVSPAK